MKHLLLSLMLALVPLVAAAQEPAPVVTDLSKARAVWRHDKARMNYFDYWIDGQVRGQLTYEEIGPAEDEPGAFVFHGTLPSDLAPGDHTFQVRACYGFGSGPCSDFIFVPFTVNTDGTITAPKTPWGATIIQIGE